MQTLPKDERLHGHEAISRLFDRALRGATKNVIALVLPPETKAEAETEAEPPAAVRVAFIAGKKLGNAVLRNRLRRRLRAAYRLQKTEIAAVLPQGCELALMAKKTLLEAEWPDVLRDVRLAAERAAGGEPCGPRPPRRSR